MNKILLAAKILIRARIKQAGDWTYYTKPENCLFGPHQSCNLWDFSSIGLLEQICTPLGLTCALYNEGSDAQRVIDTAKKLANRHSRFVAFVENWQPVPGTKRCYSDSIEQDFVNRFGKVESRQIEAVPCLP